MTDKLVVVLFGGRSSEHSISCVTARGVLQAIDRSRYRVIPVGITREGAFTLVDESVVETFRMENAQLPLVVDNGSRILWPDSSVSREIRVHDNDGVIHSIGDVDIVFPILHGPFGEDGTVQGMLELLGVPYVGSGVLASAVAMDKHIAKTVMSHSGIPVAAWKMLTASQWATNPEKAYVALEVIGLPVFVKPARAGSSLGVSKVSSRDELAEAMRVALAEDEKVIIEAAMVGRELEVGVLQGHNGSPLRTSVAGEIVLSGDGFYDFDAKYRDTDRAQLTCPASLADEEYAQMASLAMRVFRAIDCRGLARVDFFLTTAGFVVNEVNTMPGFTPISMFPILWEASGVPYPRLIDELITLGLER